MFCWVPEEVPRLKPAKLAHIRRLPVVDAPLFLKKKRRSTPECGALLLRAFTAHAVYTPRQSICPARPDNALEVPEVVPRHVRKRISPW